MRRRLLKTLLVMATITVVWLLVSPSTAFAMPRNGAPVCDPRGAIMFAPPPQIQDTELSLDIPADCFDIGPLDLRLVKNIAPGRGAPPELSSSQEPMSDAMAGVRLDLQFSERLPVRSVALPQPPVGVRESLERPPRS